MMKDMVFLGIVSALFISLTISSLGILKEKTKIYPEIIEYELATGEKFNG